MTLTHSGEMRRQLDLAMTLVGSPAVLVADATGATSPAWHRLAELAQQR